MIVEIERKKVFMITFSYREFCSDRFYSGCYFLISNTKLKNSTNLKTKFIFLELKKSCLCSF